MPETQTIALTDLASCGGCAAKYSAARLEELLRGLRAGRGGEPARRARAGGRRRGLQARRRARARSSRSTSSRRSSTTRATTARSPRRTRSTTSSRWAARRCSRSRSPRSRRSCRPRCSPRSSPRPTRRCARPAACSQAGTRFATRSRSTGSRSSAPRIRTAIWPKNGARPGDSLFLTKPLGTGLVMSGYKQGLTGTMPLERAVHWMRTLNKDAADVLAHRRAERRHRRDGLRAVRPRARDGVAERGRASCSSRSASRRSTARSTSRARASARAATRATETSRAPRCIRRAFRRRSTRSATTRRPPAGCSSRFRASAARRSRRSSTARGLFVRRIGSVEEGAGVLVR